MNASVADLSAILFPESCVPSSLVALGALCAAVSLLFLAFLFHRRFRSVENSLAARVRELQVARDSINEMSLKLRESEERFQAVFENSPYSITLSRLDGTYLAVNKAFLSRWGGLP